VFNLLRRSLWTPHAAPLEIGWRKCRRFEFNQRTQFTG